MNQHSKKRSELEALSGFDLQKIFPAGETTGKWLEMILWPAGPKCPRCGSSNVQCGVRHPSQTHRCRDCKGRKMFSLKTGTAMRGSKLSCLQWTFAIHVMVASRNGVSSVKLGKCVGVPQNTAWHLKERITKAFETGELSLKDITRANRAFSNEAHATV